MVFLQKKLHLQRDNNDCEQESNIGNLFVTWNIQGKHILLLEQQAYQDLETSYEQNRCIKKYVDQHETTVL